MNRANEFQFTESRYEREAQTNAVKDTNFPIKLLDSDELQQLSNSSVESNVNVRPKSELRATNTEGHGVSEWKSVDPTDSIQNLGGGEILGGSKPI